MQPIFIDTEEKKSLISRQIFVLNECCKQDIPVISIRHALYGRLDADIFSTIRRFPKDRCMRIKKYFDNAFEQTTLESQLVAFNAKSLLVMGVNACQCVYETVESAMSKKYGILTSRDLIGGYFPSSFQGDSMAYQRGIQEWYASRTLFMETHEHIIRSLRGEG
ncbi:MAG: isochorismatase family protein [Candidatus Moranbacteria bacterium]|nr:isochorismatase family protein [Candidatus Moranbacteria bacterium]